MHTMRERDNLYYIINYFKRLKIIKYERILATLECKG